MTQALTATNSENSEEFGMPIIKKRDWLRLFSALHPSADGFRMTVLIVAQSLAVAAFRMTVLIVAQAPKVPALFDCRQTQTSQKHGWLRHTFNFR